MATELLELQLEELSLVDRPANAEAMVTLFKRDDTPDKKEVNKMTEEQDVKAYMEKNSCGKGEAMKALGYDVEKAEEADPTEELAAEIETLKADAEKLSLENERLRKGLIDEGYVIAAESIEKKAPEEFVEYEGEQINKADIPAPILKALETAEIEKSENIITKRCQETLPNVAEANARILLKALDGLDEDAAKSFAEFLKSTDSLIEGLTEEVGKSAAQGDMEDPNEKLNALAKAYEAEHNTTFAKAYAAIVKTDEGKALIKKAYQKD